MTNKTPIPPAAAQPPGSNPSDGSPPVDLEQPVPTVKRLLTAQQVPASMAPTVSAIEQPPASPAMRAAFPLVDHSDRHFRVAMTAFFAILRRDLLVTRREFATFLFQMLLQPLFFLFIFGKVLPEIGIPQHGFGAVLHPGIVALTIVTTAIQGVALPLVIDLGFAHEIDDRLLAPLPIDLVAVEKMLFATVRGLIAGIAIFPLARLILRDDYQVRTDRLPLLVSVMILTAIAGSALGLTLGTIVQPQQIGLMFSLIFAPLIFLGCTYYPWAQLGTIRWFQIVTLGNPLTYASEGLRRAMVPPVNGVEIETLAGRWVLLGLVATIIVFGAYGVRSFHRRVVS